MPAPAYAVPASHASTSIVSTPPNSRCRSIGVHDLWILASTSGVKNTSSPLLNASICFWTAPTSLLLVVVVMVVGIVVTVVGIVVVAVVMVDGGVGRW